MNLTGQALLEGALPDRAGELRLRLADIRHPDVRKRQQADLKANAKADVVLQLLPTTPDEGDPANDLLAIGFDRQRGDQVEVVNLRFAEAPQAPTDLTEQTLIQQLLSFTREDIVRFAEMGVIALLVLIVLMVVVRPLLKQVLAPEKEFRAIPSFMRNGAVVVDQGTGDPSTFSPASNGAGGAGGEPGQIDVEALFAIKPQPCLSETGSGYLLFRIGDCVAQRNTHAAIYDALRLCKDF